MNINLYKIKLRVIFILLSAIVLLPYSLSSQGHTGSSKINLNLEIPSLALVDFVSSQSNIVTYTYDENKDQTKSQTLNSGKEDSTWINYSSITANGSTNSITVHISSGYMPSDVILSIVVSEDMGAGAGAVGRPVGELQLTHYPQNIIEGIGSCYTGKGLNKGHLIRYIWENPQSYDYEIKYNNSNPISVTYTITSK